MRRLGLPMLLAMLFLGLAAVPLGARSAAPDRYIVVLRDGADAQAVAREHANAHALGLTHVYEHALKGYAAAIPAGRLAYLKADSRVRFIAADAEVQAADSGAPRPAASKKPGTPPPPPQPSQQAPTGLRRIGGSANGINQTLANKGAGVGVAVLDTGIDLAHPDLAGVVDGTSCVKGAKSANDDHGHGTHVAGTIAARDNSIGVVGVAPAATLYAVKVLDATGSGTFSSLICGVDWVTANAGRVRVANLSLSAAGAATPSHADCTNGNDDALHTAICHSVRAGVTYVAAAGNSAADATGFVPAAYEEVITVSALADYNGAPGGGAQATCYPGTDDAFAAFSNYGAPVDLAAPGVCILSTSSHGGYATRSGTSMAAPHVAGAAVLYRFATPAATPDQVRAGLVAQQEPGLLLGDPDPYAEGVVRMR